MKLEDIQDEWTKDSNIDRSELGEESLKVPQLHSKYYKMYSQERMRLRQMESDYRILYREKYEYYNGTISEDDLNVNGWEPFMLKILKTDIPTYMESDPAVIAIKLKLSVQEEKVDFLESIIKSLPSRGYQIKAAIDWEKFKVGA